MALSMSLIRRIGKACLRFVDYNVVPFFGWLNISKNRYVNVIYYHDVVHDEGDSYMRTNLSVFVSQMEWLLKQGCETLCFDELNAETQNFKKMRVLITFDDGWKSNYTEIFDYMRGRGLKYNVFLTVGEIGINPEYMTWEMVREMHDSGVVGFGVHTYTHPSMADLTKVDFHHEVKDADILFEEEMGYKPLDFCYPFGYYSEESNLRLEKESGYQRIYTSQRLYSYTQNGRIVFGRNGISTDYPLYYFKKKVKGYANWHQTYYNHFYKHILNLYHFFRKR